MATNKNQHFVPRCYLRQFTVSGIDRAINVFNIDNNTLYPCASLAKQCSGDYFYGKDPQLESGIQMLEGRYATAVRRILGPGYILSNEDAELLKVFWLFQRLRTEAAAKRAVEIQENIETDLKAEGTLFRLSIREAVQTAMGAFPKGVPSVSDLRSCLVRNTSGIPFVASDDPAILTNRWHLHNALHSGFGLQNAGNLLLLPLSPSVLFVAYDSDMHSFKHRDRWLTVRTDEDIDAFNQHQYLNCHANLFVQDTMHFSAIQQAFSRVSAQRIPERFGIRYFKRAKDEGGLERYDIISHEEAVAQGTLVLTHQKFPKPLAWPRQLRWRDNGHAFFNGSAVGYVRKAFTQDLLGEAEPFKKVRRFFRK